MPSVWGVSFEELPMVDHELARLLQQRGIRDGRVLASIAALDREQFVPETLQAEAHTDQPLAIGYGQTISQPFVVAFMTEQLLLDGSERALEVGTGSGYQAAVLAPLVAELWTLERVPQLAWQARERFAELGLDERVHVVERDGWQGLPEHAPYDAIIVTAAAPSVPDALLEQLARGGRMVLPVGESGGPQHLQRITRREDGSLSVLRLLDVQFVPMLPGVVDAPRA